MSNIQRSDFSISTSDGIQIAIREVRGSDVPTRVPMVLLHGTRIPGLSEYDLPVENGSLAADLARKGHLVYILDARGFGRSERPAEMNRPPEPGARPLVRAIEITRDIEAAVDDLRAKSGWPTVGLFGWGVGGTCVAMYAALWPEKVSHIVLYMMIYGGVGSHPNFKIGSRWDDPDNPGRFNQQAFGNYTFNNVDMLLKQWDSLIPIEDKAAWRDPAMPAAFREALIDGDPVARRSAPPAYRSPNGMLEDLFYMGCNGWRLFHASQIYCRVMIVGAEFDNLCRDDDMEVLKRDLVHAEEVVHWRGEGMTHYVLLDRPERGRDALLARMDRFLDGPLRCEGTA